MRMVCAARPVRSATSLIARPFTARWSFAERGLVSASFGIRLGVYGASARRDASRRPVRAVPGAMPPALRDPDPVLVTGATGHVGARARGASRPRARPGVPREVQLGGPDVLSHRAMIERAAGGLGRRPPA